MLFTQSVELELFNGDLTVAGSIFLIFVTRYILVELKDLHLGWKDWAYFQLPAHISFAVAVWVFDFGVIIRSALIWYWRRFDGGKDFIKVELAILMLGSLMTLAGALCKIRSISRPIYGARPWAVTLALILLFMAVTLYLR